MSHFIYCYAECRYAECRVLFTVVLSVVMLNVVTLSVVAPLVYLSRAALYKPIFYINKDAMFH